MLKWCKHRETLAQESGSWIISTPVPCSLQTKLGKGVPRSVTISETFYTTIVQVFKEVGSTFTSTSQPEQIANMKKIIITLQI